jgi:site-specific recombinase XerC
MNRLLGCIRTEVRALSGVPNEETYLIFRDRALLETLYSAALRVSELCNLNWHLDIAKRELRVMHGATKRGCVRLDSTRSMRSWNMPGNMKTDGNKSRKDPTRYFSLNGTAES